MAVPTVITIDPEQGHSAGGMLVEITGTNFRLPVIPLEGNPGDVKPESVVVLFGDVLAENVDVASTTRLFATTPNHALGKTSITIRNVDETGAPILGEEVIVGDAFEFIRPKLTGELENMSDLLRLVEVFINELKKQVVQEVVVSTHTDYDPATGAQISVVELAQLPAITLIGPHLTENRFYSRNEKVDTIDGDEFVESDAPYTVDVEFDIIGASDRYMEMVNLQSALTMFFRRNVSIKMDRLAEDPSAGQIEWELDLTEDGDFKPASLGGNTSNLSSFAGRCVIRGFDIEDTAGLPIDRIGSTIARKMQAERRGAITDAQGATLDPVEQLGVASPLDVRSASSAVGQPSNPGNFVVRANPTHRGTGVERENLIVRSILSHGC